MDVMILKLKRIFPFCIRSRFHGLNDDHVKVNFTFKSLIFYDYDFIIYVFFIMLKIDFTI